MSQSYFELSPPTPSPSYRILHYSGVVGDWVEGGPGLMGAGEGGSLGLVGLGKDGDFVRDGEGGDFVGGGEGGDLVRAGEGGDFAAAGEDDDLVGSGEDGDLVGAGEEGDLVGTIGAQPRPVGASMGEEIQNKLAKLQKFEDDKEKKRIRDKLYQRK